MNPTSTRVRLELGLKRLAMTLLPHELLFGLWHYRRRGKPRSEDGTTEDLRVVPVQSGARLDVYWTRVAQGAGPCASLFVLDEEVLRLDCFAGANAHMHLNPVQLNLPLPWHITPRHYFPPGDMPQQIDRAAFELARNAQAVIQMNQRARVRKFTFDSDSLATAAQAMKAHMLNLMTKYAEPGERLPHARIS